MACWIPTSDADRARTILAVGGPAHWRLDPDDEVVVAPFVAHGGTPLLLVDHDDLEQLFDQRRLSVALQPSQRLGTLFLTGRPRVPTAEECGGDVRRYRYEHAECGPGCGASAIPVALEIVQLGLTRPDGTTPVPMALSELRRGEPQESFLAAYAIAHHLNSAHPADLIRFAAGITRTPAESLLAAPVSEITATGLLLTLIDHTGASPLDVTFPRPVSSVDELGAELHRLLVDGVVRRD